MMYRLSLIFLLLVQGCSDNNIKTITVHYLSNDSKDTLKIELVEQIDTLRRFTERITVPVKYYRNGKIDKFIMHYTDNYYYIQKIGLFKNLNSSCSYLSEDFSGHFHDFLWLPDYIFEKPNHKYISWDDRGLAKREWDEYSLDLRKYDITLKIKEYSHVYRDTLYTIVFNDVYLNDQDEIRVYDSNYNMVKYIKVIDGANDSLNVYSIMLDDYDNLKLFRSNLTPMFKN